MPNPILPANATHPLELEVPTESYSGGYHTGCQGHLFLNGTQYFGEAVGISYSQSIVKTPIYGHRSTYFDRIAVGQVIVQGTILINLTDFRYMNAAVGFATGELAKGADVRTVLEQQFTLHRMPDLRGLSQREVEWIYHQSISGLVPSTLDPAALLNPDLELVQRQDGLLNQFVGNFTAGGMSMAALHQNAFDLVMVLGSPNDIDREWYDRQNITTRRIVQLHITGEATEIMSNDNVLIQAFPFIAKSLDYNQGPISAQLKLANGSKDRIERLKTQMIEASKVYVATVSLDGESNTEVPETPVQRARKRFRLYLEDFLKKYEGSSVFDLMKDVSNPTFLEGLTDALRDSGAEESVSQAIVDMIDRDFANGDAVTGLRQVLLDGDQNSPTVTPEQESAWKLIKRSERVRNPWGLQNKRESSPWKLTKKSESSHPPMEETGAWSFENIRSSSPQSFENLTVEGVRRLPTDDIPDLDDPLAALESASSSYGLF